jgi:hypothetical protein
MEGGRRTVRDQGASEKAEGGPGHRANDIALSNWALAFRN